mmetsp:Transcript_11304/g.9988  ORF Transcript_11304/g.9988 Transcript_11304/m.9988 type:complete len:104 (-) Transcript_11304:609-920(-)
MSSQWIQTEDQNFNTEDIYIPVMGGWAQHRPALESPIQFNTFVEPVIKKENNTIDEIELSKSVYNLSDRDDVVNKSVIRLIRRFFMFGLKKKFRIVRYRAQDK